MVYFLLIMCLFPCLHLPSFSRSSYRVSAQRAATALTLEGGSRSPALSPLFLRREPPPFTFYAAAVPSPGKRGTLVTKCPLGVSSADPSIDSSDCSHTGQQLLTLVSQPPWGTFSYLLQRGREFPVGVSDLLVLEPLPTVSTPGRLGVFSGSFTASSCIWCVSHTSFVTSKMAVELRHH